MRLIISIVILFVAHCGVAAAADEQNPDFTVSNLDAKAFKKLYYNLSQHALVGSLEIIDSKDKTFLSLRVTLTPKWTEEDRKLIIENDKIQLVDKQGGQQGWIGYLTEDGVFVRSTDRIYIHRPGDWKTKTRPFVFRAVFLTTKDASDLTLKLGDKSLNVSVPKTDRMPHPLDLVNVDVVSTRMVDRIHYEEDWNRQKFSAVIGNTAGKLLEVTIRVTPNRGNQLRFPDLFEWRSNWIGVMTDGRYVGNLGQKSHNGVSRVTTNRHKNSGSGWRPHEATFYFAVPEDTTAFKVFYLMREAASGTVAKE